MFIPKLKRPLLGVIATFTVLAAAHNSSAEPLSPMEELGKALFHDATLSNPPGQSCASCHDAALAFTGNSGSPIAAIATGSTPDKFGNRNVPTLKYMAFSPPFSFVGEKNDKGETEYTPTGGLFFDGRADNLIDQVHGPLLNVNEMADTDNAMITSKLRSSPSLQAYKTVFGEDLSKDDAATVQNIAIAIAAFESTSTFAPFSSKFDSYLQGKAEFTAQEAKGFELFKDPEKGNCLGCHVGTVDSKNPKDWLFTDFTYDNLGVPRNPAIPANAKASYFDEGLCQREGLQKILPEGVELSSFCGAFKVPTLRNIAVTAPYFHNGAITNLRDTVAFYVTRDTNPELWYPKSADGKVLKLNDTTPAAIANVNTGEVPYDRKPGETPRLSEDEIDAVVAFLKTLTDTAP